MDPDEPIAPWFDDVFERLGDGRSTTLRRRLAATRGHVAALVLNDRPDLEFTPDVFVEVLPLLVVEAHLPTGTAAARSYVSALARLVDAAAGEVSPVVGERARCHLRAARQLVDDRASNAPADPAASRIPRRLL